MSEQALRREVEQKIARLKGKLRACKERVTKLEG